MGTRGIRLAPLLPLPHANHVASTIVTRAPTRIDFGGGWTDVPPYSNEAGGFVCNVAISRYATVTVSQGGANDDVQSTSAGDHSITAAAARRFRAPDAAISVA